MKNVPNILSFIRLALSPGVLLLSHKGEEELSAVLFISLALTDALDGFIARVFRAETLLGKMLDPVADKFLLLFGLASVTFYTQTKIEPTLLVLLGLRDTYLVAGTLLLKRFGFIPRPTLWGKATTLFVALTVSSGFATSLLGHVPAGLLNLLANISIILVLISWMDYTLRGVNFMKGKLIMERQ